MQHHNAHSCFTIFITESLVVATKALRAKKIKSSLSLPFHKINSAKFWDNNKLSFYIYGGGGRGGEGEEALTDPRKVYKLSNKHTSAAVLNWKRKNSFDQLRTDTLAVFSKHLHISPASKKTNI